jgi:hypothetical protein
MTAHSCKCSQCKYLANKLNTIVPLLWLDGHSPAINQLSQVNGMSGVNPTQVNQILQPVQGQGLVLSPPTVSLIVAVFWDG